MKKTAILLGAALVVLLGLWWWMSEREKSRQLGGSAKLATQVDTNTVDRFVIMRHNEPKIVIVKDADGFWNITEPVQDKANVNFVRQLVHGFAQMKLHDMVSNRSAQQDVFEVNDLQAAHVQAFTGDEKTADLYLGKTAPDGAHLYVRRDDGGEIYTATGGGALAAFRTRSVSDLRDRTILDLDVSQIDSLEVTDAGFVYTIARADTMAWKIRLGSGAYKPADRGVTESVLQSFAKMRATGFADDTTVLNWDKPVLTARSWQLEGTTNKLEFQTNDDGKTYWVRREGKPHVYKVFESAYKAFKRDPKTLAQPS
jgi:hypothetical protein